MAPPSPRQSVSRLDGPPPPSHTMASSSPTSIESSGPRPLAPTGPRPMVPTTTGPRPMAPPTGPRPRAPTTGPKHMAPTGSSPMVWTTRPRSMAPITAGPRPMAPTGPSTVATTRPRPMAPTTTTGPRPMAPTGPSPMAPTGSSPMVMTRPRSMAPTAAGPRPMAPTGPSLMAPPRPQTTRGPRLVAPSDAITWSSASTPSMPRPDRSHSTSGQGDFTVTGPALSASSARTPGSKGQGPCAFSPSAPQPALPSQQHHISNAAASRRSRERQPRKRTATGNHQPDFIQETTPQKRAHYSNLSPITRGLLPNSFAALPDGLDVFEVPATVVSPATQPYSSSIAEQPLYLPASTNIIPQEEAHDDDEPEIVYEAVCQHRGESASQVASPSGSSDNTVNAKISSQQARSHEIQQTNDRRNYLSSSTSAQQSSSSKESSPATNTSATSRLSLAGSTSGWEGSSTSLPAPPEPASLEVPGPQGDAVAGLLSAMHPPISSASAADPAREREFRKRNHQPEIIQQTTTQKRALHSSVSLPSSNATVSNQSGAKAVSSTIKQSKNMERKTDMCNTSRASSVTVESKRMAGDSSLTEQSSASLATQLETNSALRRPSLASAWPAEQPVYQPASTSARHQSDKDDELEVLDEITSHVKDSNSTKDRNTKQSDRPTTDEGSCQASWRQNEHRADRINSTRHSGEGGSSSSGEALSVACNSSAAARHSGPMLARPAISSSGSMPSSAAMSSQLQSSPSLPSHRFPTPGPARASKGPHPAAHGPSGKRELTLNREPPGPSYCSPSAPLTTTRPPLPLASPLTSASSVGTGSPAGLLTGSYKSGDGTVIGKEAHSSAVCNEPGHDKIKPALTGKSHGADKGKDYEKSLHAFVALRSLSLQKSLGPVHQTFEEPGIGSSLDDLALRYEKSMILFQIKHMLRPKELTLGVLRTTKGYRLKDFLTSYEESKITALKEGRDIQHVVLFTNRFFQSNALTLWGKPKIKLTEIKVNDFARPLREVFSYAGYPGRPKFYKFSDDWLTSNRTEIHSEDLWPYEESKEQVEFEFLQKFVFAMSQPSIKALEKESMAILQKSQFNLPDVKSAYMKFCSEINRRVRGRNGQEETGYQFTWGTDDTETQLNFIQVSEASTAVQKPLKDHMLIHFSPESPKPAWTIDESAKQIIRTKQLFTCAQLVLQHYGEGKSVLLGAKEFVRFTQQVGVVSSCLSRISSNNSQADGSVALVLIHDRNTSEESLSSLASLIQAETLTHQEAPKHQVILITNDENLENPAEYLSAPFVMCAEDLHDTTIRNILDVQVKFQGEDIPFRDVVAFKEGESADQMLRSILDPETIEKLVRGKPIKIGSDVAEIVRNEDRMGKVAAYKALKYFERKLQLSESTPAARTPKNQKPKTFFENDVIEQAMRDGCPVVISAPFGMGKSTLLKSVCIKMRETKKLVWVLFCDLKDERTKPSKLFGNITESLSLRDFKADSRTSLLMKSLFPDDLSSQLEMNLFLQKLKEPAQVCLLFDSFDQIENVYGDRLVKFVDDISNLSKSPVWVMTRKQANQTCLTNLSKKEMYVLQGLTEQDQVKLLYTSNLKFSVVQKYVDNKSFLGNPFHVTMLGEVLSNLDEDEKSNLTRYTLYDKIVDYKIESFLNSLFKSPSDEVCKALKSHQKPKIIADHQQLAALLFDRECRIYEGSVDDLVNSTKLLNFGLLHCFEDELPQFVHQTYADFFLSSLVVTNAQEPSTRTELVTNFLKVVLQNEKFSEVWRFVDDKLSLGDKNLSRRRNSCYKSSIRSVPAAARLPAFSCFLCDKRRLICRGEGNEDKYLKELFINAVACCNIALVKRALELPEFDVNTRYDDGITALHVACSLTREGSNEEEDLSHIALVILLLDAGGRVQDANEAGMTALHFAVKMGNKRVVEKLLNTEGCDVKAATNDRRTALHFAAEGDNNMPLVDLLMTKGCDTTAKTDTGRTALHFASEKGHHAVIDRLTVERDCVHAETDDGWTALHFVASGGQISTVELLLSKGCKVNVQTKDGSTPLHFAAGSGNLPVVQGLLSRLGDNEVRAVTTTGWNALHEALHKGMTEVAMELVTRSDVGAKTSDGRTALHFAVIKGNVRLVKRLLQLRDNLKDRTKDGWTALHFAAKSGSLPIVKCLLDKGSDVNAATNDGWTALHFAADREDKGDTNVKVAELLLRRLTAEQINAQTKDGSTALMLALKRGSKSMKRLLHAHTPSADMTVSIPSIDFRIPWAN